MRKYSRKFRRFLLKEMPKFETASKAKRERKVRIADLRKADYEAALILADVLADCAPLEPCGSAACPVCFRGYRIAMIQKTLRMIAAYDDVQWCVVTLIFYGDALTDEELKEWHPKAFMRRLREQLRRLGIQGPIVGSVEVDRHTVDGLWQPHFHLLIPFQNQELKNLRMYMKKKLRLYLKTPQGKRRKLVRGRFRTMKVQSLEDDVKQISYLYKSYWKRIERYETPEGKKRTPKPRLLPKHHVLSLLKLDEFSFSELLFEYGTRTQR